MRAKGVILALLLDAGMAEERTGFRLRHVVPAGEALRALTTHDTALTELLLREVTPRQTSFIGMQGEEWMHEWPSEPVAMVTKEEYTFRMGSDVREQDSDVYQPYFDRLPVVLPKPEDHGTVLSFARMAANSYVARTMDGWRNATDFTDDDGFGWNSTGLRGHVFTNDQRTIVVVSFKGTSTIMHGGETVARDKYMDNIMFSCCCARVDISWTPVCGCFLGQSQCDAQCLAEAIRSDETSYYREGLAVVELIMQKYPRAQIWFTGHSLGGAIAALMAVAVRNTAAITFASPGPYLYARHLGLDVDEPGTQWRFPVWNFGLASDPIYMGTCTGLVTSCYLSGYAMETACRHGMDCVYEVQSWQPDVSTHRIDWFIDHVLERPDKYGLPQCLPNRNCTDCLKWSYT